MSDLNSILAHTLWRLACEPARRRFKRALADPAAAQAAVLQSVLRLHAGTSFAREHSLRPGMSIAEYQAAVPMRSYKGFLPMIERMKLGIADELCKGAAQAFERSSGSTGGAKYIPFTPALKGELQEASRAWMGDLFSRHGGLVQAPMYWLINPQRHPREMTMGGIPVGLAGDDEAIGACERMVVAQASAVPAELSQTSDLDQSLLWTLRHLIQQPDLRIISVWHPSYLLLLWKMFLLYLDELLDGLRDGTGPGPMVPSSPLRQKLRKMRKRAEQLRQKRDTLTPKDVWPRLTVISMWADGEAASDAEAARKLFPGVVFQPKGLLAAEGVVTIPWGDDTAAGAPALRSHFLEFVEPVGGPVRLVHELEEGREYAVLLTTGGGLWRYRLGDLVRAEGRAGKTPRLRLVGRADEVSNFHGERLTPQIVADALAGFGEGFRLLAPCREVTPSGYILFASGHIPVAAAVDQALRANSHYAAARDAGLLGEVRVFQITDADPLVSCLRRCVSLGQKPGTMVPSVLHRSSGWEHWFEGDFVEDLP